MQGKWNSPELLVWRQNDTAILENAAAVSYTVNHILTWWEDKSILLLSIYLREMKIQVPTKTSTQIL